MTEDDSRRDGKAHFLGVSAPLRESFFDSLQRIRRVRAPGLQLRGASVHWALQAAHEPEKREVPGP